VKNQIAAFRLVNPRGVRIGVLFQPDNAGDEVAEAENAAGLLRVIIVPRPVASEREIPAGLRELLGGDTVDALWMPADPVLLSEASRRYILAEATKAGKPVYTFSASIVAEGALVSNGADYVSIGEQVGDLVNRLASGERGRIELLVPRAELVINKRLAGKLKVEIPAEALKSAAKVF
jgi:putative ABC transport system substrate-binding protein